MCQCKYRADRFITRPRIGTIWRSGTLWNGLYHHDRLSARGFVYLTLLSRWLVGHELHRYSASPPYRECGETSPYFSFQADITLLDPAWTTCKINAYGGFDPPRALNKAAALVSDRVPSATLDPGLGAVTTSIAAPGSRVGLTYASATATSAGGRRTGNAPHIIPRPHKVPFSTISAHTVTEYDQYNSQNDGLNKYVAQESDQTLSDNSNRVHVGGVSRVPVEPLLVSQTLGVPGTSFDSSSPESVSTVLHGNNRSFACFIPGLNQSLNATGKADNSLYVQAFTGGCSGKGNEIKRLCIAIVTCMGFRVAALVL